MQLFKKIFLMVNKIMCSFCSASCFLPFSHFPTSSHTVQHLHLYFKCCIKNLLFYLPVRCLAELGSGDELCVDITEQFLIELVLLASKVWRIYISGIWSRQSLLMQSVPPFKCEVKGHISNKTGWMEYLAKLTRKTQDHSSGQRPY